MKNTNRIYLLFFLLLMLRLPVNAEAVESDPAFLECSNLLEPLHGSSDVPITTDLTWTPVWDAVGYYLKVGTFPGGGDIMDNVDVGNVTTYDPGNFPCYSYIFVTITPYDGFNTPPLCNEEVFETEYVVADAGPDVEICSGNNVLLCANGGVYYSWEPAELFEDPNVQCPWVPELLETTEFWVTVTNENGCWDTDFTTVYTLPNPAPNLSITHNTCFQCNDGTATMDPLFGEPPYSYQWSTGETTQSIQNLSAGEYWAWVQDVNYCSSVEYFTIYEYDCPEMILTVEMVNTCVGSCNGHIDVTDVFNGTPPFSYNWSTGQTSSAIYSLCAGDYTVTVTDAFNCPAISSFYISEQYQVQTNLVTTHESCNGCNNGMASVYPSGGFGNYWISWSTGESTSSISNLAPGFYSVTVGDEIECFMEEYFTIEPFICPELDIEAWVHESCFGACDGFIEIYDVLYGTPPFTYAWSTGASTGQIYDLCPGTYEVTVTDAVNCTSIEEFELDEYTEIQPNAAWINESCYGCNNGSAMVIPSGEWPPFWYQWSTGETTQVINNLAPGTYSVLIGDEQNCTIETSVTIQAYECPELTYDYSIKDACHSECNGYIAIYMTGGEWPYSYEWNTGETTSWIEGLCPGSYTVTVTDYLNCSIEITKDIFEMPAIISNLSVSDESCFGCNNGEASVAPTGGTSNFWYEWSTGEYTASISGLAPGDYWVIVGDAEECQITEYFSIVPYDCPSLSLVSDFRDACYNSCDAYISISNIENGIPPFTYNWSNGQTTEALYNLCPGDYTVTATDSKNCSLVESFTILELVQINPNATATDVTCMGCNDGTASVNPANGSPPYWYEWSTGETSQSITGLAPGIYTVTVGDAHECMVETSVVVNSFDCPGLQIEESKRDACFGVCNGYVSIFNIINATDPIIYAWSNGETSAGNYNLCPGSYTVTATDANNCTIAQSFTINEFSEIIPNASSTDETCENCNDGTATANPGGGTPPYWYEWSNGATTQNIANLAPGTYTVTVGDAHECTSIQSVDVVKFGCPDMTIEEEINQISCFGKCDGSISITNVTNTINTLMYNWNNGSNTSQIENLCEGNYLVTVTDVSNGCSVSESYQIIEPPDIQIIVNKTVDPSDEGPGSIEITTNNDGTYTYTWEGPDGYVAYTEDIYDLSEGCYHLIVANGNDCSKDITICLNYITGVRSFYDLQKYLIVFPNPADRLISVKMDNRLGECTSLLLMNLSGKRRLIDCKGRHEITIDAGKLENGLYLLTGIFSEGIITKKIVINR
jgi:hypothetical protein